VDSSGFPVAPSVNRFNQQTAGRDNSGKNILPAVPKAHRNHALIQSHMCLRATRLSRPLAAIERLEPCTFVIIPPSKMTSFHPFQLLK
jgi:hypothetical protein